MPRSTSLPPSSPARTRQGAALVERAVAALEGRGRLVLAVSGGLDSMVLLDACARHVRRAVVAVATFDHGTGAAARAAADLVRATAAAHGIRTVSGRSERAGRTEAAWRTARWDFLHHTAALLGGAVVTAHTADDQAETVFMRVLRGAGTRGLAGLRAPSGIARPLLGLGRAHLAAYARARGLAWVEDPSNASRAHLRNRVRLDLLPAVERVHPGFRAWLLDVGERAAAWRAGVDALLPAFDPQVRAAGELSVAANRLEGYDAEALGVIWPALAARAGVTLDRRGTRRLAEFTMSGAVGGRVQLSGGFEVVRRRDAFALRRSPAEAPDFTSARPLRGALSMGPWRFRPIEPAEAADPSYRSVLSSVWAMELPAERELTIRGWRAGDRMRGRLGDPPRRVKRFLAEAGIPGTDRAGWPVVFVDGEIVWIPGVRRSDAALDLLEPAGRRLLYLCERDDGEPRNPSARGDG